ncbi:hypothetical protein AgCh_035090 [Apium graveolens]
MGGVDFATCPGSPKSKCGNRTVPYPFGINSNGLNCSVDPDFGITCHNSTHPPLLKLSPRGGHSAIVYDISNSELRISNYVAYRCYDQQGFTFLDKTTDFGLIDTSFLYSAANVFTVVGCDDFANIYNDPSTVSLPKGCSTTCDNKEKVNANGTCTGSGCCQVPIDILQYFRMNLQTYTNNTSASISSFNKCGYAFMAEKGRFNFSGTSDLDDQIVSFHDGSGFWNRTTENVPLVLDWAIGDKDCTQAAQDSSSPLCHSNSACINGSRARGRKGLEYRCKCINGYEGNPYLSPGCKALSCSQKIQSIGYKSNSVDGGLSWLSLDNRLRIASESSGALAYLHSATSMPSELTDKSDVYSFGVVLAELLTGRRAIYMENSLQEKNLATYFITSLEENRLFQVLDHRVVREVAMEQLEKAAQLVKRCLNPNGEERPTMKKVMMEIESLRKLSKHPWGNPGEERPTMKEVMMEIESLRKLS